MVQWLTVLIMLVLSQVLGLKIRKSYYTNKFSQDPLNYDEEVYINPPHGFDINKYGEYVKRLNYALYGMIQLPKRCFYMLYMGIQICGMDPSDCDTCIFMGEHVICAIYVDYC